MNVINRKTKEIRLQHGKFLNNQYLTIDAQHKIYITKGACTLCDLTINDYVHFLNEDDDWRFYVDDNADGFKPTPVATKGGVNINHKGLTRMILKSTGFPQGKRFYVQKTNTLHDRCPVFRLSPELSED